MQQFNKDLDLFTHLKHQDLDVPPQFWLDRVATIIFRNRKSFALNFFYFIFFPQKCQTSLQLYQIIHRHLSKHELTLQLTDLQKLVHLHQSKLW